MTVNSVVSSVFGTENFADFEQNTYEKYQEMAEQEIIAMLRMLLCNTQFLDILKDWGSQCAVDFINIVK